MPPSFQPINEDHAVALCEFAIGIDGPLSSAAINHIASNHDLLRDRLPAVAVDAPDSAQAIVPTLQGTTKNGVTFATLRADGSHVWSLNCAFNEIRASCTRYTRWQRSWDFARELFTSVLPLIAEKQGDRKVGVAALYVVDQFIADDVDYKVEEILQRSKWISEAAFSAGPVWHCNNGWFEPRPLGSCLQILNVRVSRETGQLVLSVVHHQQLRLTPGEYPDINDVDTVIKKIDRGMNDLHQRNKEIVTALLAEPLARRVKLLGEKS